MKKIITAATIFNDAVGMRLHAVYSTVDEETGTIASDNKSINRVVTDTEKVAALNQILAIGQEYIDGLDS